MTSSRHYFSWSAQSLSNLDLQPSGPAAFLVLSHLSFLLARSKVLKRRVEVGGKKRLVIERDGVKLWEPTGLQMCKVGVGEPKSNLVKNKFYPVGQALVFICLPLPLAVYPWPVIIIRPFHISQTLFYCNCSSSFPLLVFLSCLILYLSFCWTHLCSSLSPKIKALPSYSSVKP